MEILSFPYPIYLLLLLLQLQFLHIHLSPANMTIAIWFLLAFSGHRPRQGLGCDHHAFRLSWVIYSQMLHTRWFGIWSTPESTTVKDSQASGPKYLHETLQSVLRAASRLVLPLPHRASVSDIMRRQLHWLEMPYRVRFRLCTLVYRCLWWVTFIMLIFVRRAHQRDNFSNVCIEFNWI